MRPGAYGPDRLDTHRGCPRLPHDCAGSALDGGPATVAEVAGRTIPDGATTNEWRRYTFPISTNPAMITDPLDTGLTGTFGMPRRKYPDDAVSKGADGFHQ